MKWPDDYLGKIFNCDCMEIMKQLPDKCVDLCLCDPPYGIGDPSGTIGISRSYKHEYSGVFEDNEEYIKSVCVDVVNESIRISKAVILTPGPKWFCLYPSPTSFGVFRQPASVSLCKWGRADAQPIFYYGVDYESGKKIKPCSYDMNEIPEKNGHPCPKPINTWSVLVERGANIGGIVFDPFMGSGTTAVACERLGRKWFGCELEPKYVEIANKRIEAERAQLKLF